jgi:hypothetical protein
VVPARRGAGGWWWVRAVPGYFKCAPCLVLAGPLYRGRVVATTGGGEIWNFAIMKTGLRWIAIKFVGFVQVPLSTKTHTLKCLLAI